MTRAAPRRRARRIVPTIIALHVGCRAPSEDDLRGELHSPWIAGTRNLRLRGGKNLEDAEICARIVKVYISKHVECFGAKLEPRLAVDDKLFEQGKVADNISGTDQLVT